MPAKPYIFATSSKHRELYIGRSGKDARGLLKPRALKHWSDADWRGAQEIGAVPRPYESAFLRSFSETYTRRGYRLILGPEILSRRRPRVS